MIGENSESGVPRTNHGWDVGAMEDASSVRISQHSSSLGDRDGRCNVVFDFTRVAAFWLICIIPLTVWGADDPPEIKVGERLFLETRFAQFFRAHATDPNKELVKGDPTLDFTVTTTGSLTGPFRGRSMNCRACHLVDEHEEVAAPAHFLHGGMRAYDDFAQRSPISHRNDGKAITLRNSPTLVGSGLAPLLHFDGEFDSLTDLVIGTWTGRNLGWLQGEERQAIAHIIDIVKRDDGTYPLSLESGGAYRDVLRGAASVPEEFRLTAPYVIDIDTASDAEILAAIAKLVAHYVDDLSFIPDDEDTPVRSPFDAFVEKNSLPAAPMSHESPLAYARRMRQAVESLANPVFITEKDGAFAFHDQEYVFGERELAGLKIFFAEAPTTGTPPQTSGIGNCIACHSPPHFSDFGFHNTGVSQEEYDSIHGDGEFGKIKIPEYSSRKQRSQLYLPQKAQHPTIGGSQFADVPSIDRPGHTDFGLWNVFLNPAIEKPQQKIRAMLQEQYPGLSDEELLKRTVAAFKTSGLRDLGHSGPFFHTGRSGTVEDAMRFYVQFSAKARDGTVRNADSELGRIYLNRRDVVPLTAFLRSLNEDYE